MRTINARGKLDHIELDFNYFYFAHPQSLYNKPPEWRCERDIKKVFDTRIVNPRFIWDDYDVAIENSDAVVFMADNYVLGKGTVSNVSLAHSLNIPVYYYEDEVFYRGGAMRLIDGGKDWKRYAIVTSKGEVYHSLKPRLAWLDKLNAK